ncbi:glycosyltransferase [Falsiroseomonas sp.]|uniref:glycosyltransferase n=1 Tax=Falsiroseomonas sp. TaxID=2870721 RepID=UPI003564F013
MRILFVSDHAYLPQRVGGTKSSTHELCLSLRERGHKVGVLCHPGPRRDALWLYHRVARRAFGPERPVADHVLGYPVWRRYDLDGRTLRLVAARLRAEAVVVQAERASPLIAAALETGLAVFVYLRDVELHKLAAPPPRDSRIRYIANSGFTAGRYREVFGIDPIVLPPLMRPERYRCTPDRRFVTFVNPVPVKGSDIAFALAAARPDLDFLFVAGWPVDAAEDDARQERARRLGNVTWQPSVQDMRRVYSRTRLLLAPSRWEEAWGRVASEAQMSGIPVLASDRGGLPEAVGPGGLLVPHDAPVEAWTAALSAMLDDPARYAAFSRAAAEHAARPEIVPDRLIARLEDVLAAHVAAWPRSDAAGRPARPAALPAAAPAART